MRLLQTVLITAAIGAASTAIAASGEFKNECALGLALGKHVKTDCSVNSTADGKVYCFSSEDAKAMFSKDPKGNMMKAQEFFASGK